MEIPQQILGEIENSIINGDSLKVKEMVLYALEQNVSPETIIKESFIPGMETVSIKFQSCEYHVAQVLTAADSMQTGVKVLKDLCMGKKPYDVQGTVIIGTIEGDIHDIGKNIVALTLEGAGYEVIDLGVSVSPAQFVEATKKYRPDIICISALLTVTMLNIKDVILAIKEAGLRNQVKIIIGGAPITQSFADSVGADGYDVYGTKIIHIVRKLLDKKDIKTSQFQLDSIFNTDYQEIFQKIVGFKPDFLDQNGKTIFQGERIPEKCKKCSNWYLRKSIEKAKVYYCNEGLCRIEEIIEINSVTIKIVSPPISFDNSGSNCFCNVSVRNISYVEVDKFLIVAKMIREQLQSKEREQLMKIENQQQKENVIRVLKFQDELKDALNEANYRSLQSQVNPHFLFNSLNSLARLAMLEGAEETEKFAHALSMILRYILRSIKGTVTIEKEIEMIKNYSLIQQIRFSERLSIQLNIDEDILDGKIPCMAIQPLVENAIVHGTEPFIGQGIIEIRGTKEGNKVLFTIMDNGVGINPEKLLEINQLRISNTGSCHLTGLGILNVHQRLQHYFGSSYGLEIDSKENRGTTVKVYIPYITTIS